MNDAERAGKILEELRSRPGLYHELLRQAGDAGEVLDPWVPRENSTAWERRKMGHQVVFGEVRFEVLAKVKGSGDHYSADVLDPNGNGWFNHVESTPTQYGRGYSFPTLDAAMAAADCELAKLGFLLPPARGDAVVGPWKRPKESKWPHLKTCRVGDGCRGLAQVFMRDGEPGDPPYQAVVDGEQVGDMCHSERLAMDACDHRLLELGYVS